MMGHCVNFIWFMLDKKTWIDEPELAFHSWLASKTTARGPLALKSVRAYRAVWNGLCQYAEEHLKGRVTMVSSYHLARFLHETSGQRETRRRYLLLLDRLFDDLKEAGVVAANPTKPLWSEYADRTERDVPNFLEEDEVERLWAVLSRKRENWKRERDRAMAVLMLEAGCTVIEAQKLRTDAVMLPCIQLPGHSPLKARRVPLGRAAGTVAEWMTCRQEMKLPGALLLPGGSKGSELSTPTIWRQIKALMLEADIAESKAQPRVLRATFIARLLRGNMPVGEVSELAGHWLEGSTLAYAGVVPPKFPGRG